MTGARPVGSLLGISDILKEYLGGGTFAAQDLVMMDGSGEAIVATATSLLLGVANEAGTASSTGVQINITPYLQVIMDNDNDSTTFTAAHVGEYADFVGATAAMYVDSSSHSVTTRAELWCLEYNPQGYGLDSDVSIGKYAIVESYLVG